MNSVFLNNCGVHNHVSRFASGRQVARRSAGSLQGAIRRAPDPKSSDVTGEAIMQVYLAAYAVYDPDPDFLIVKKREFNNWWAP